MSAKINLLSKRKTNRRAIVIARLIPIGSIALYIVLSVSAGVVYWYWSSLSSQRDTVISQISTAEKRIDSYNEVEIEKSIISAKVSELEHIRSARFDYIKAIDDVQKLFGYTLSVESLMVSSDGNVSLTATKREEEVRIIREEALTTNISGIELRLLVASSDELQNAIDSLSTFYGGGLTGAIVKNTERTDDGGYQMLLELNLKNNG